MDVEFLHVAQNPSLYNARRITGDIVDLYKEHLMDEVYVVYTHMINSLKQEPRVLKLLSVEPSDFADIEWDTSFRGDIFYEPSPKAVFDCWSPSIS